MLRVARAMAAVLTVIAALAALGAPGALAAGRSAKHVIPVERAASLSMPATNGWHLHVDVLLPPRPESRALDVEARNGWESVTYHLPQAYSTPGGTIRGKLPGVGRVAVHFKQTKEKKLRFTGAQGCKSDGTSIKRSGWFVGTIEFHGEGGYTDVSRRRAFGQISEVPQEVCRASANQRRARASTADSETADLLIAGRNLGHGRGLSFDAFPIPRLPGLKPSVDFNASYYHSRRGMFIWASTRKLSRGKDLSVAYANGSPSEATVEPPAPFTGSATFKLETPTKASWTGNLTAEIPTLGAIGLTGAGTWSAICTSSRCSKTLPAGQKAGTVEFQTIR